MNTFAVIDYVQAGMLARHKTYRAGQGLFNAIALVRPEWAEEIRGKDIDPFYNNGRIRACAAWLHQKCAEELNEASSSSSSD